MIIRQNMHVHTWLSLCAKEGMTLPRIAAQAEAAGLEVIGIADHMDRPDDQRERLLLRNRWLVEDLDTSVRFLVGSETSALAPGRVALSEESRQALDFVAVAADHYHLDVVENPDDRSAQGYAVHYLRMVDGALDLPWVDIISHPFGVEKLRVEAAFRREVMAAYDRDALRRLVAKAGAREVAFEIKPPRAAAFPEFFSELLALGRHEGVRFALGSDAHKPDEVGYGGPEGLAAAVEALEAIGLREDDLFDPDTALRRRARAASAKPVGLG